MRTKSEPARMDGMTTENMRELTVDVLTGVAGGGSALLNQVLTNLQQMKYEELKAIAQNLRG